MSSSRFAAAVHPWFDNDDIDEMLDNLWRYGSVQDYPKPEIPPDETDGRRRRWSTLADLCSQTIDRDIDDPPVPGYRDWPAGIVVDYAADHPIKAAGIVKAKRRK